MSCSTSLMWTNIIRVGSAGAISPQLKVRDVVFGQGSCTDSNYAHQFGLGGTFAPIADFTLLETAVTVARKLGIEPHVGSLLSSDVFYNKAGNTLDWGKMGVLAVEMESAALYCNAAEAGKRALAICTISDSLITGEELPACRPPDHLHPDDGDRPGRCCGDGEEVRRVQKRRIRPRGHAGEA